MAMKILALIRNWFAKGTSVEEVKLNLMVRNIKIAASEKDIVLAVEMLNNELKV